MKPIHFIVLFRVKDKTDKQNILKIKEMVILLVNCFDVSKKTPNSVKPSVTQLN